MALNSRSSGLQSYFSGLFYFWNWFFCFSYGGFCEITVWLYSFNVFLGNQFSCSLELISTDNTREHLISPNSGLWIALLRRVDVNGSFKNILFLPQMVLVLEKHFDIRHEILMETQSSTWLLHFPIL
jgi:hypothetical protein